MGVSIAFALLFTSCGGGGGPVKLTPVSTAGFSISSTVVSFGNQAVGTTSAAETATLINVGDATLTVSSIQMTGPNPGDYALTNTCGSSLAPQAQCTLSVTFTPSATGTRTASVVFTDNAAGSPQTVNLTGTGIAAAFTPSAASLDFGSLVVAATSAAQTETVTNSGTASLTITSVGLTGANAGDFGKSVDTCTGALVAPGSTCAISVTFTPAAMGSRTATLSFNDNAGSSPQAVNLAGTGVNTPAGTNVTTTLNASSGLPNVSLMFPSVMTAGDSSEAASTACSAPPTHYSSGTTANCVDVSTTAVFAGMVQVTVGFNPGNFTNPSAVRIFHLENGTWVDRTVSVNTALGTMTAAATSFSPFGVFQGLPAATPSGSSLSFGNQVVGTTAGAQSVTVTNSGAASLIVSTVTIGGANASDFAKNADTCTGATVAPNGTCAVTVSFSPTATGARSGSVTINDNASDSPQTVSLSGTGTEATITATAGTPQSATISTAFGSALQATVKDSGGNPVPGVVVTFTAPGTGPSASFAGGVNTATTNASGVAIAAAFTANSIAGGPYNVVASATGATAADFVLTNAPGAPASITATSGTPQSATIGTTFGTALQATVKDSGGNPVPGVVVTFTAPASGPGGAFAGGVNTATTNSSGLATASTFTANSIAGGPYNVVASATGATSADFALTNTVGPAASITATSGTPQSATISTAFGTPLQATVKDSGGNPVAGVVVTFTAPASVAGGTFAGGGATYTTTTNSSGVATATTFTANSTAGPYNLVATATGASAVNFALTNTPGAPASITAAADTPQSATIGTAFGTALQSTVKDSGGNPVSGVSVTFTAPATGAGGTFAGGGATYTATTNSSGVATATTFTANSTAGPYNLVASATGASAVNFALTNTAGAPASITATAGTPQSATISTAFGNPLQATVKDSAGNPVPGVVVTFTAPGSGASGTFAGGVNMATTNASGVAISAAFTANSIASGPYNVMASAAGATPANFALTNAVGAPASITATAGTPQTATIGTAFGTALQATVKDSGGNPVPGVVVTLTAPGTGASGSFADSVNTATTNASGVATTATFTANSTVGGPYNVVASATGATAADFALTNTLGTPVPFVNEPLVPASAAPGGPSFTLTVNGTGFVSNSVVNWNGSPRSTQFISDQQLTVTINASDITTAGTGSVTVVNPTPGGGSSNVGFFQLTVPTSSIALNRADVAAGISPHSLAARDFNGDGNLDLAVANSGHNTVSILLGNGDGTFQPRMTFATGQNPRWLTGGDFNGDGKLDLAVANFTDNTVSILLGNGDGTFQPQTTLALGTAPISLLTADFNRDGNLDLAVANSGDNTVSILLGNGDGTFQPQMTFATGQNPRWLATGDFNSDGKLDLAVANFTDNTVSILLGNGDGTFQTQTILALGTAPTSLLTADFNGDGNLDLAVSNSGDNTVSIILGDGSGTFPLPAVSYAAGASPESVIVGDFKGDGNLDLAVTHASDNSISVLVGNGDGTFQTPTTFATAPAPQFAMAGDFNKDGRLDLVTANFTDNTVSVLLQSPQVTLSSTTLTFPDQWLGTTSPAQTITLGNTGSANLSVSSIVASGDFAQTNNCGTAVAAGSNCTVWVTFTPTMTDYSRGSITITDNAAQSPQTVGLSGNGIIPHLGLVIFPTTITGGGSVMGIVGVSPAAPAGGAVVTLASNNPAAATVAGSVTIAAGSMTGAFSVSTSVVTTPTVVAIWGSYGTATYSANLTVTPDTAPVLSSLAVTPSNALMVAGDVQQFTATGTLSDASTEDLTHFVTWISSNPAVATITSQGVATGLDAGSTTIQASLGSISASSALTVRLSGLLGYWTFDDGSGTAAADSSGYGHTATLVNGISWVTGEVGGGISANGLNQFVGIPAIDLSGTLAITVAMWVNRTYSTSGGHTLFEGTSNFDNSTTGFGLFPDDSSCSGIKAGVQGDIGYNINCYSQPSSGAWHHLAVVYDKSLPGSNEVALYLDGALQTPTESQATSTNTNTFGNDPIYLFSRGGTEQFTTGTMDDLQLYNRALSASEIQQIYSLGAVAMAGASVSPASLSFTSQALGTTSEPQAVTLSNPGSAALEITSIATNGDFAETNNCGSNLAAGTSCTINVTFTPTAAGGRTATLTIRDTATDSPQTVVLTGTGPGPLATLIPPLDFGSQRIGKTTAGQVVILSNSGTATLNIASIGVTGTNATDFAVSANTCGRTLPANASCLIIVTFTPAVIGSRSATLMVTDDSMAGSTQTVDLTGTGAVPIVSLSPTSLTFSSQAIGVTSARQTITLSNTGGVALGITSITLAGTNPSDFTQTNNCGASVAAGSDCTINLTFTPTVSGTRTATIIITDDAAGSPHSVSVTGTGEVPPPLITSAMTATVTMGSAISYQITAANAPTSYGATGLPAGLTVDSGTGLISGTPTVAGTSKVTLSATNSGGTGNATLTLAIAVPIPASFVQAVANINYATPNSLSLPFPANTLAGDLILVALDYDTNTTPSSVSDSQGNIFAPVGNLLSTPGGRFSQVYYAKNIKGGADTVTVILPADSSYIEMYLTEYRGIDPADPIDVQAGAAGAAGAVSSGNATTTMAGDVIYGYCVGDSLCKAGSGFTARSNFDDNLIEDTLAVNAGLQAAGGWANAGWTMQMVALKPASPGGLTAAVASLSPSRLTFTSPAVGAISQAQTVTLTNTGNADLTISAVTIGGTSASDFAKSDDTCTGATVTPNGTCMVSVTFTPTLTGARYGSITITDDAADNPQTVRLLGTVGNTSAVARISTSILTFGNQPVDTTSSPQAVILNNTGSTDLSFSITFKIWADPADFVENDTCSPTVAAGGSCTITILFTPSATGKREASLTITDNASGSLRSVLLSGTGTHDVILTWTASPNPQVTGYNIFRGTTPGGESATPLNSSPVSGTTFVDVDVQAGQTYYYVVAAVGWNESIESSDSNEASVTVPSP